MPEVSIHGIKSIRINRDVWTSSRKIIEALHRNLDEGKRRGTAMVWGGGIESSDWPPNEGPAREPGARILGVVR
jgi:hypothetical protein